VEALPPDAEADQSTGSGSGAPLAGGRLLSAISTGFVQLLREHYGRGPLKAKTYALDDIVVCVMRGSGFTPLEQTMMNAGDGGRVVAMREDFQGMMAERYKDLIERLTQRKVLAFLSQAHIEPDITIEVFFIDRPLEGFGAVEVLEAAKPPLDSANNGAAPPIETLVHRARPAVAQAVRAGAAAPNYRS
jgi:uncharacterized protein YbcI